MSWKAMGMSAIVAAGLASVAPWGPTPAMAGERYETAQLNLHELDRVLYAEALYDAYCDAAAYYDGDFDGVSGGGYHDDSDYGRDGYADDYYADDDGHADDAYVDVGYADDPYGDNDIDTDPDYSDGIYLGDAYAGDTYAEEMYGYYPFNTQDNQMGEYGARLIAEHRGFVGRPGGEGGPTDRDVTGTPYGYGATANAWEAISDDDHGY